MNSLFGRPFQGVASPFGKLKASVASFSPALLFAASEPGVWYDPSDLTTMFQDRSGSQPVTTPGQSVGLILDKSRGLVSGPDRSNSPVPGTRSIPGSVASWTTPPVAGRFYLIEYEISASTWTGDVYMEPSQGPFSYIVLPKTPGRYQYILRAQDTKTSSVLQMGGTSPTGSVTFTRLSVREVPGNHMVAISDAARGTYGREPAGGRRNLLTFSEQFDNTAWVKERSAVTPNAGVALDGTLTADKLVEDTTASNSHFTTQFQNAISTTSDVTASVYLKAGERTYAQIRLIDNAANVNSGLNYFDIAVDLVSGTISSTNSLGSPINTSYGITSVGNGWHRVWVTLTKKGDALRTDLSIYASVSATAIANPIYTGDGTSGILIWGAQLETGSAPTNYQRVTTAFDVTEVGVSTVHYVQFDGADDGYVTSTITPGADEAQVFAGVRKLSDAAAGTVAEFSVASNSNSGSFHLAGPGSVAPTYFFRSRGSLEASVTPSGFAAPITNVLTGVAKISTDTALLRVNGVQIASSASDQGTGNFLAYPLYIGRRGGTSLPFNGRIYSLIVRFGSNLPAETVTQMERWVAQRTGVTL